MVTINVMMHVPKLPDFEECFLEIAIFGQYVGAGFAKI
jgi:hypothetical protein